LLCDQSSLKIIKRIDKKSVIFFAISYSLVFPRNRTFRLSTLDKPAGPAAIATRAA
jgi:hypothetical protein